MNPDIPRQPGSDPARDGVVLWCEVRAWWGALCSAPPFAPLVPGWKNRDSRTRSQELPQGWGRCCRWDSSRPLSRSSERRAGGAGGAAEYPLPHHGRTRQRVFTRACETHGRSAKYNGEWFTGLWRLGGVRLPAEVAPQHQEFMVLLNQLWKVEKIQFIQPVQFKDSSFKTEIYLEL